MNVLATETSAETPEPFSVSATGVFAGTAIPHDQKAGDTFGVFDHGGDILSLMGGTDGLYHRDTRHLSRFDLALGGGASAAAELDARRGQRDADIGSIERLDQ